MFVKGALLGAAAVVGGIHGSVACTGISLKAADGSYIQGRTIEWSRGPLKSEYVIIPRGEQLRSYTPTGANGLQFKARYGVVGLAVVEREFIAEGINEAGLSAGLFFFPRYGSYVPYDATMAATTLADLQVVQWILTQFSSIDQLKKAVDSVRIVGLERSAVVHWRVGEPSGRQIVMEIVGGQVNFYDNTVGVLTNAPSFPWQLANLNNYVNLRAGDATDQTLGEVTLQPLGGSSGMLGLPGDFTPPSRFVRAAFFRNTAPQRADGWSTVQECFHLLNNFDVPIAIENPDEKTLPSATQWTTAIDLTTRKVYYKTAYNNSIRCIELATIDFGQVRYQSHPLDREQQQPVEMVEVQ
ncbi:MAG: choloylglycine hydrolase family protein [Rikenellaceae bacterium]|nr:choloylglycine hydrolase family protein [Rikenellaceae bacterium]